MTDEMAVDKYYIILLHIDYDKYSWQTVKQFETRTCYNLHALQPVTVPYVMVILWTTACAELHHHENTYHDITEYLSL